MYNVIDYGAVSDYEVMSTKAFQTAVNECKANGGGVVYVPFGTYVIASITLCSNVHFIFEPGVNILGSLDPDDYNPREKVDYKLYQDASHSYFQRSMFAAEGCDNISFEGRATIDMREVWENEPIDGELSWTERRAAKIFSFKECKNIAFSDMTLLHATDVALYMAGCENVKINRLSIDVNIDAISPDCCRNVVISDCIIRSGDDSIVLKSSYGLNRRQICENITVSNCIVTSRCNAIKLGTESNGGFKNIVINGCVIYDTYYGGISVESADGGDIDGIVISNITMRNVGNPIFVILSDRARGPKPISIGSIQNVIIDNITATGPYTPWVAPQLSHLAARDEVCMSEISPCTITGQSYKRIKNISLSNIFITVPGGGTEEEKNTVLKEITKDYPENRSFGDKFPVYGMYFRHIDELKINNVNIETIEHDERNAFGFEDVKNLKVY